MAVLEQIAPISAATKAEIERLGAAGLPDNPSEEGMTTEEIKRAFYEPLNRAITEINRIVSEANQLIGGGTAALEAHAEDKNNPHEVSAGQVAYGEGTVEDALDAEIVTDKLADGAVTDAKVASGVSQSKVSGLVTDYVADAEMSGSALSLKNKSGSEIASVAIPGAAFRKVGVSDRDRGGTSGAYTFSMEAGKKYLVAVFGEVGYKYDNFYFNHDLNRTYLVAAGINRTITEYVRNVGWSGVESDVTVGSVSGNTLSIADWKYYANRSSSESTPGMRHVVVFEIVD